MNLSVRESFGEDQEVVVIVIGGARLMFRSTWGAGGWPGMTGTYAQGSTDISLLLAATRFCKCVFAI
jgi:hypothetical protein